MPHELPHDRVPRRLRDLLHRMADVAHVVAGARLGNPRGERVLRHLEQSLGLGADSAHGEGRGRVGVQAVEPDAHVHAQHVAVSQNAFRRRDPVDDLGVDRGAQRGREVVQPLERRARARVGADKIFRQAVQLLGGHSGADVAPHECQRRCHDAAGRRHRLDLPRRLECDHRPMMRWISVAMPSIVPVPGTRCTMPRCA